MIFECKDVTLGYENKVVAKNLNFKIDQGDYLCVVGENGTGKSTLINEILYKSVANKVNRSRKKPGKHKEIKGIENIDKIIKDLILVHK